LPAAASNGGAPDEAQARAHDANNTSGETARVRVFVLDNELKVAAIVGKVLEAGGFSARTFTAMPQFFAELTREPPDLVVLDLSLGDSNAVEVICRLKASDYRGKVLLIGGRDETTLCDLAQVGANHGLAMLPPLKKPFRPADVRQRYLSERTVRAAEPNLPQPAGEGFWPGLADYQAAS
jgi:DNA-binding response OmpR family regulator